LALLSIVVISSGCGTPDPEIKTNPSDQVNLEGNASEEVEVWVHNDYNTAEGFRVEFEVQGNQDYLTIEDSINDVEKYSYNLGEAADKSDTNKQVVSLSGNTTRLSELGVQSVSKQLTIKAFRTSSNNGNPVDTHNLTVTISR